MIKNNQKTKEIKNSYLMKFDENKYLNKLYDQSHFFMKIYEIQYIQFFIWHIHLSYRMYKCLRPVGLQT